MSSDTITFVAGIAFGGLGTLLMQRLLAPGAARRIRRDETRDIALGQVVAACDRLEQQLDFMLSPERLSPEGIFQTHTVIGAGGLMRDLLSCWRSRGEPYLPEARHLEDALLGKWNEAEAHLPPNPPQAEFFDDLRELRGLTAQLRRHALRAMHRAERRFWSPGGTPVRLRARRNLAHGRGS